ncbi:MAG: precorrin-4 C(11)-methyltransferase [Peptococcaceae bacterium]|nr:precorrin-4 C(11)-methyltransferase [Peptococcaceae bacterium]
MIHFIGAGPGDPELITVKGARIIAGADVVIYAGSLVNRAVLDGCKPGAEVYDSSGMSLEEVLEVMFRAWREGKKVARVHTGDPSIYGAIQEQMDALAEKGIPFEVVPGVSSVFAAAAAIPRELTLPGVTQTVIMTRLEGRTPVPGAENLRDLARHGCTMCIFLSVNQIDRVTAELLQGGYGPGTGVVVVEKASWPDQRVIRGTLENIGKLVKEAGITRQALILVGDVFVRDYRRSRLYDPDFSHGFRGRAE